MLKRKHRVVVEIMAEDPISVAEAVTLVDRALESAENDSWCFHVRWFWCKQFGRVLAAAQRSRR